MNTPQKGAEMSHDYPTAITDPRATMETLLQQPRRNSFTRQDVATPTGTDADYTTLEGSIAPPSAWRPTTENARIVEELRVLGEAVRYEDSISDFDALALEDLGLRINGDADWEPGDTTGQARARLQDQYGMLESEITDLTRLSHILTEAPGPDDPTTAQTARDLNLRPDALADDARDILVHRYGTTTATPDDEPALAISEVRGDANELRALIWTDTAGTPQTHPELPSMWLTTDGEPASFGAYQNGQLQGEWAWTDTVEPEITTRTAIYDHGTPTGEEHDLTNTIESTPSLTQPPHPTAEPTQRAAGPA